MQTYTISSLKNFVAKLKKDEIFTTSQVLNLGKRSAVDKAIASLVKQEIIIRVARGVFVRSDSARSLPSAYKVMKAKAEAFGREVCIHGKEAARKLGLLQDGRENDDYHMIVAASGGTSSFKCYGKKVVFKRTGTKKRRLGDTPAGILMRAVWYMGYRYPFELKVPEIMERLTPYEKQELRQQAKYMPGWLMDRIYEWLPFNNPSMLRKAPKLSNLTNLSNKLISLIDKFYDLHRGKENSILAYL